MLAAFYETINQSKIILKKIIALFSIHAHWGYKFFNLRNEIKFLGSQLMNFYIFSV